MSGRADDSNTQPADPLRWRRLLGAAHWLLLAPPYAALIWRLTTRAELWAPRMGRAGLYVPARSILVMYALGLGLYALAPAAAELSAAGGDAPLVAAAPVERLTSTIVRGVVLLLLYVAMWAWRA